MNTTKKLLGARIRELRKSRNLSQEQLTDLIGVEPRHVSRLEVGSSYPTIDRLEKIAAALNVPLKDFFDFMHLANPDVRAKNIEKLVKGMKEEHQKIVYKIVQAFKDY